MHYCQHCKEEKPSLKALRSHERLCKANPLRASSPFQNLKWQKKKGTNQYLKARQLDQPKPQLTEQARNNIRLAALNRKKKPDDGSLRHYRARCSFTFNVYDYPEEFDLSLLETFGWYKAANRGNNLNGISRDHMFSVKEGFERGIDPLILSHPANCCLLRHNDNVSKNKKSSITLEELMHRIEIWNSKYTLGS
jgi:hypothetical protein